MAESSSRDPDRDPDRDPVRCLEPVALRLLQRLAGAVAEDEDPFEEGHLFYELVSRPPSELDTGPSREFRRSTAGGPIVRSVVRPVAPEPFPALLTPLAPLRERAEAVRDGEGAEDDYPVFFTREALARAEAAARRGANAQPPVETGGLLVGPLCSCPATGEMFAVVVDVLEAAHAEGTKYSLTYSGETWARIQTVMRAKRAHPETSSHRLLGQVHGHSFLPMDGAEPCEECAEREVCTRTSAFLSPEDRAWCRAVFRCEPWQLSQVFGLDARGGGVEAFYGQRGGLLVPRGYHLIDDFRP